jgi:hypothetical protein
LYRFFSFGGKRMFSSFGRMCVCVHNDYLVRKCNWDFEDIYSVYMKRESKCQRTAWGAEIGGEEIRLAGIVPERCQRFQSWL